VLDAASGQMALRIDGISTPDMQAVVNVSTSIAALKEFTVDVRNPVGLSACLDEIAVYPQALPDSLVFQHFEDTLKHHKKYSDTDPGGDAPAPPHYPSVNDSAYKLRAINLPFPNPTICPWFWVIL